MEGLCSGADSCKTRSVGMYPLAGAGTLICAGGHLLGIAGSSVGRVRTLSLSVAVSCLDPGAVNCWLVVKECIAYMRYKLCALDPWTGCRGSCWWREPVRCKSSTICRRLFVTGHVVLDVCMSESRQCALARRVRKVVLTVADFCGFLSRSSSQLPECRVQSACKWHSALGSTAS